VAAAVFSGVLVALSPTQQAGADSPPAVVPAASDFATDTWSDPWDFSNSADLNLNVGPTMNLKSAKISGGVLRFFAMRGKKGYFSPLWGGYPGSLLSGRDGGLAQNKINASVYKDVRIHVWVANNLNAALYWFTCYQKRTSCIGGMPVYLTKGWNDFVAPIANNSTLVNRGKAWTGSITDLRFAFNAGTTTEVRVDDIRVTAPTVTIPVSLGTQLWWTDGSVDPSAITPASSIVYDDHLKKGANQITADLNTATKSIVSLSHWTQVGGAHNGAWDGIRWYSDRKSQPIDVSGFPPGSKFYTVATSGGAATLAAQVADRPLPVVTSPTQAGCGDYATSTLGHPWLTSKSDVKLFSAKLKSFKKGKLTAVNARISKVQPKNDPHVNFRLGKNGIDGRTWYRLTIVESYQGAFNLGSGAGGGTMSRVIWKLPGKTGLAQTADLVTYAGKQTIFVDLHTNPKILDETEIRSADRYGFNSRKVTLFRFDPNEDRGSRVWSLYSVILAKDCATTSTYNVTWHDNNFAAGTTVNVIAFDAKTGRSVVLNTAPIAEGAGTNSYTLDANALTADGVTTLHSLGKTSWTIKVQATSSADQGSLTGTGVATGPLIVS
jgi:hypothetical protein